MTVNDTTNFIAESKRLDSDPHKWENTFHFLKDTNPTKSRGNYTQEQIKNQLENINEPNK